MKFNQTISPTSSNKEIKTFFFYKKRYICTNDDYSNQTVETTAIDDNMKEYFKLRGEHTNTIHN
ncbi:hypothetical protein [Rickettsia australis]|uniref:Uncharacterized protein n=1 Tax=Rickettsia australis (strain Cutlack) TaxID=1105110 RepID=H8K6V6_RICAC|nr:hypothetical protein [Rickettsia australis]AFC70999.1 hypothetical protein MC5_03275 [Rickettsia australis str. Cutlack]